MFPWQKKLIIICALVLESESRRTFETSPQVLGVIVLCLWARHITLGTCTV